jgi:hypothetical protein
MGSSVELRTQMGSHKHFNAGLNSVAYVATYVLHPTNSHTQKEAVLILMHRYGFDVSNQLYLNSKQVSVAHTTDQMLGKGDTNRRSRHIPERLQSFSILLIVSQSGKISRRKIKDDHESTHW